MKKTRTRDAVKSILLEHKDGLTPAEIFRYGEKDHLTLSTVYRTLATFEKEGLVKKDVSPFSKDAVYTWKEKEHSHYLECTVCHKKVEIDGCPFEEVNSKIEKETGFAIQDENAVLYGICPSCRKKLKEEKIEKKEKE